MKNVIFKDDDTNKAKVGAGAIFKRGGEYYLLAQVDGSKLALISLDQYANRWVDPVEVGDQTFVTKQEFHDICEGQEDEFEYFGKLNNFLDRKVIWQTKQCWLRLNKRRNN